MSAATLTRPDDVLTERAAAPRILVELLGGLRLHIGGNVVTRFRTQKAAGLLAFLAYHRDQRFTREVLAEKFWPDALLTNARASLAVALSSLRNQLEPPGTPANTVLISDSFSVSLNPARITTDVVRLTELLARAEHGERDDDAQGSLREALQMGGVELLPGFYDDWIFPQRERIRERTASAAYQLSQLLERGGKRDEATHWVREAVRTNPTHSEAVTHLFKVLMQSGQESEAAACYAELKEQLGSKWGIEPPAEVQSLVAPILSAASPMRRRGRPCKSRNMPAVLVEEMPEIMKDVFAPAMMPAPIVVPMAIASPKTEIRADAQIGTRTVEAWLPLPLTRFYGREGELHRLRWMLENPTNRLITLTGPGGSGKTRLALTLAERMRDPGGELRGEMRVLFIGLAEVRVGDNFVEAIAQELGITEPLPKADPLAPVVAFLTDEPTLLILDNFEQLVDTAAAATVKRLLQRVPSLTCLVTSRMRLPMQGEQDFPIAPLVVPEEGAEDWDIETLLRDSPAVALFVDRAQLSVPHFQINRKNAPAIVELVRRLEGIPLAIELAAARTRIVTPAQMVVQTKERFNLLVSHRPVLEERHRSLRNTMAWSLELLPPEQIDFFARLSVLRGAWTAADAEAITGDMMTADYLALLADASLLQIEMDGDDLRFRMLETVREFAAENLLSRGGEAARAEVTLRHTEHFLTVCNTLREMCDGPEQFAWIQQIRASHDNCCAALEACLQTPGEEALRNGIRIAAALNRYWRFSGWHQLGRSFCRSLRARSEWDAVGPGMQSSLLNGLGILEMAVYNWDEARPLFEEARRLRFEMGDEAGAAAALNNLAKIAFECGNYNVSIQYLEQNLLFYQQHGDVSNINSAMINIGCYYVSSQNYLLAQQYLEDAGRLTEFYNQHLQMGWAACNLGFVLLERGNVEQARNAFETAIKELAPLRHWHFCVSAVMGLGRVAEEQGNREEGDERIRVGLDYCTAKGISPLKLIITHQSPYWQRRLALTEGGKRISAKRAEERLLQTMTWILEETRLPTLR